MSEFTAKLPALSLPDTAPPLVGNSTASCMHAGVLHGMALEIKGYADELATQLGKIRVILTGGDAIFFESMIKADIFVSENLILEGLNAILQLHVLKK